MATKNSKKTRTRKLAAGKSIKPVKPLTTLRAYPPDPCVKI